MKTYGYTRISTSKQSMTRQIENIKKVCPEVIIKSEVFTGTKIEREEWGKLKKILKKGDTIIFDSVSRMSRNSNEGIKEYNELMQLGIKLVFLKEPYINTDVINESIKQANNINLKSEDELIRITEIYIKNILMIQASKQIKIAFEQSEKEVKDLQERTKEGLRVTKNNGTILGRKTGAFIETKKSKEIKEKIKKLSKEFKGTLNDIEVIELLGVARNTFYKYKKQLKS